MPEVVLGEVGDLGDLQRRMEGVLDVLNRLASLPTGRMSKHKRAARRTNDATDSGRLSIRGPA